LEGEGKTNRRLYHSVNMVVSILIYNQRTNFSTK
jgi:hypothetical protein